LAVAFVALLVEEFFARYRRGERPALAEYVAGDPELAEQIQAFFPALVKMERIKPADGNLDASLCLRNRTGDGVELERTERFDVELLQGQ
jgi:hypothetical protein